MKSKYPEFIEYGRQGGKTRSEKLTPERRAEIAKEAAKKRWEKTKVICGICNEPILDNHPRFPSLEYEDLWFHTYCVNKAMTDTYKNIADVIDDNTPLLNALKRKGKPEE